MSSDETRGIGRPTKYQAEYNELVYKLCLLGATDKEIAKFLDIAESTLNNWKIEYPDFMESITRGKEHADMEVAQMLFNGTQDRLAIRQMGFKCKRVNYDPNTGKKISEEEYVEVVDLKETIPADFRNQQFWLKNRKSSAWRDRQEFDHTTDGNPINLAELPTDTLKAILSATRKTEADS